MSRNICLAIAAVVVLVLILAFLVCLQKLLKSQKENQILRRHLGYQRKYRENVKAQYEDIRRIRHELKNNYFAIVTLLDMGKIDRARKFIADNVDYMDNIGAYANTDSDIFNAIVNCKATAAKEFGIKTSVFTVSDFSGIDELDLCAVIGNMFDNAVEMCQQVAGNRQIDLAIKKIDAGYLFCMKSTVEASVLNDKTSLASNYKTIRVVAKKYHGTTDFYEEDNLLVCNALIKPSEFNSINN